MSEMIERVADALEANFKSVVAAMAGPDFDFKQTGVTPPSRDVWLRYAREAVLAMREPDDAMLRSGEQVDTEAHEWCLKELGEGVNGDVIGVWYAMIDEALKP